MIAITETRESGLERESVGEPLSVLTRRSMVALVGGLVSQLLKFVVLVYVARRFSSSEFGLVAFALAVYAYIFVVSHFGLPVHGSREVAKNGEVSLRLLAAVTCTRALLGLLAIGVALLVLSFLPGVTRQEYLLVAMFGLSNLTLAGFFDWAFQGLGRQEGSAILNMVWQGLWLFFTVVGVQAGAGISIVPISLFLSAFVAAAVGFVWLWRTGPLQREGWEASRLLNDSWQTLKSGTPLGIGTMLITVIVWTDTITVRVLQGEQAVGWYAAGNRAALAAAMLGTFYLQGAFPLLSRASSKHRAEFQRYFQHAYNDLALIFLPGTVWAIFYAPQIMQMLFKRQEYLVGVPVFQVFQLVLWFFVVNHLYGTGVLLAHHQDGAYQRVLLITACVFLLLCPLATFLGGIRGAALATLATQMVSFLLFCFKSQTFVRPKHAQALLVPCGLGLLAGAVGRLSHLSILPALVVLLLAYAGLLAIRLRTLETEGALESP